MLGIQVNDKTKSSFFISILQIPYDSAIFWIPIVKKEHAIVSYYIGLGPIKDLLRTYY